MVVGILAHVDAGKTTLIEAMLYHAGVIRQRGRVDHKNSFLDYDSMERARGITIFSKQVRLHVGDTDFILMDTPGHVDFSSETERVLSVLDVAVLLISATDGVQSHTRTLWRLLNHYHVPTVLFINKTDLPGFDRAAVMAQLQALSKGCVDFIPETAATDPSFDARDEQIVVLDPDLMARYFQGELPQTSDIVSLIRRRLLFPCFFGAALRGDGVDTLLAHLELWAPLFRTGDADATLGALVYKISRDPEGNRLTWLRLFSGTLRMREVISYTPHGADLPLSEKVSGIRRYSGSSFTQTDSVCAGDVCALLGLSATYAGQALGGVAPADTKLLQGVLTYELLLPPHVDAVQIMPQLRQLEEEDPTLHITYQPEDGAIQCQLMGDVQLEILQAKMQERFGIAVAFDEGHILYRETISAPVEGVGHYEPLRHYAEVHLYLEPLPPGSGIVLANRCDSAVLDLTWQHQILSILEESLPVGVLGGFPITDLRITLVSGRAHLKHTEGGDFRQATFRALRQGLMRAAADGHAVLLEPMETLELELPRTALGRAMTELQNRGATLELREGATISDAFLVGRASVWALRGYAGQVAAYTHGLGKLSCAYDGYAPCGRSEDVLRTLRYEPERDLTYPCDSVFCANGAGFSVPWHQVEKHMHLPPYSQRSATDTTCSDHFTGKIQKQAAFLADQELEAIMEKEFGPIRRRSYGEKKVIAHVLSPTPSARPRLRRLVLDGYNIIFGWDALHEIADESMDTARRMLIDAMCSYAAFVDVPVDLVFDAYRVRKGLGKEEQIGNVHVVYTKETETADAYIEQLLVHEARDYSVCVVTSDRLIQVTAVSTGVLRMPVSEFIVELEQTRQKILRLSDQNSPKKQT